VLADGPAPDLQGPVPYRLGRPAGERSLDAPLRHALLTDLVVASPTAGLGGRVLRWAGCLLAAGLVASGVMLAVDGVLDV
jgi:hypothetical protein